MAAIDPSAEPEYDDLEDKKPPRSTLKIVRVPGDMFDESDSDDDEEDDMLNGMLNGADSEDESEDDEDVNGGPSDLSKSKKAMKLELAKAMAGDEDEDEDEDENGEEEMNGAATLSAIMKGKEKASDEDEDDEEIDDVDDLEMEEVVICTLDPEKVGHSAKKSVLASTLTSIRQHYQQPIDFVVGEDERIFFKVTGTHTVHLTGNYVVPVDDGQAYPYEEEEDDEDEEVDSEEEEMDALMNGDSESDELDDLEDPRVREVDEEEEAEPPKLAKDAGGKGKNKRPAPASDDESQEEEANLDDIMTKSLKAEEATPAVKEEPKKLTKSEKKKLKKLKKTNGEAADATPAADSTAPEIKKEAHDKAVEMKKEASTTNGEKKVQFAKNLEQGPTPSATPSSSASKTSDTTAASKASLGVKTVKGVEIDDRKLGTGSAAKKDSKVEMRYIGKLENGKVFDSNKKGKPFSFKLGTGSVISGWDIGIEGIAPGGERRITVPADKGYGSKGAPPDIPPNAKLIFDVKCLAVN